MNQKHKIFKQIACGKSNASKNKIKEKYKKITSIDIMNNPMKKSSYHKIINHSQNKEEHTLIKKINNMQRPIGRSTTFEVFKIKNPKRNYMKKSGKKLRN